MQWKKYLGSQKIDTEVIVLKQTSEALLFYVKNGKGTLYEKSGAYQKSGLSCLFFNDIPLIKFHGDEYMCPTCEQLISAGYGLDSTDESKLLLAELSGHLNSPYIGIETSFNNLKPLLGLLKTGYYQLSNEMLFPTDGNGRFFWAVDNTPVANPASAPTWDSDSWTYSTTKPQYLLPSQAPGRLNMERVKHYQQHNNFRAIAYHHLGSYLCTLLDGHHKATACALEAKPINTLVISRPQYMAYPDNALKYLQFSHFSLTEDEFVTSFEQYTKQNAYQRMTDKETQAILNLKNAIFDQYQWSDKLLVTSKNYNDVHTLTTLEFAGDLSEQRLYDILHYKEVVECSILNYIIKALFITQHKMATLFAMTVYKNGLYQESWKYLFAELSQNPSDEVTDFFVEFLIDDDAERPLLTKIVDVYFQAQEYKKRPQK